MHIIDRGARRNLNTQKPLPAFSFYYIPIRNGELSVFISYRNSCTMWHLRCLLLLYAARYMYPSFDAQQVYWGYEYCIISIHMIWCCCVCLNQLCTISAFKNSIICNMHFVVTAVVDTVINSRMERSLHEIYVAVGASYRIRKGPSLVPGTLHRARYRNQTMDKVTELW